MGRKTISFNKMTKSQLLDILRHSNIGICDYCNRANYLIVHHYTNVETGKTEVHRACMSCNTRLNSLNVDGESHRLPPFEEQVRYISGRVHYEKAFTDYNRAKSYIKCPKCGIESFKARQGWKWSGKHKLQMYKCCECNKVFSERAVVGNSLGGVGII